MAIADLRIETAMETASVASAWCIQRSGAAVSIPWRRDLPSAEK